MLTTITPYWGRPEMLKGWLDSIRMATVPGVEHIIYFVNEKIPDWWFTGTAPIRSIYRPDGPGNSIGHYHNLGAAHAETEWIMKLDLDCVMNVRFFRELLEVLRGAKEREWFNAGMIYLSRSATARLPSPVTEASYSGIMSVPRAYTSGNGHFPQATNFVCRRKDYLALGGCDERFRGYGWEDYQQLYMLEKFQRGRDPLPGTVTIDNVTSRCRDEISRPKAKELHDRNRWLVLFHRWHQTGAYKTQDQMGKNRNVLFDYVETKRGEG